MSANELLRKIQNREAVLRSRAAETAAREAELQDLRDSLTRLERTRGGIRDAIEDALSWNEEPSPSASPDPNAGGVAPADLIELAVEGGKPGNPFEGEDGRGNLAADEAVGLGLIALRDELGPKDLVKFIIMNAVQASGLDAEEVIKAALETVGGSELTVDDVVWASLEAARNAGPISARDILEPAVRMSSLLGKEMPVIVREMFYAASLSRDPAMIRSSVLSVLGCAMGMGMTYEDLMEVMKAFSREVKHGAFGGGFAGESPRKVRPSTPLGTQNPDQLQSHHPQQPQPSGDSADHGDTINPVPGPSADNSHLDSINDNPLGIPAEEEILEPMLLPVSFSPFSPVPAPISAKRSASDEEGDNSDAARPSKKLKTGSEDGQDGDK